MEGASSSSSSMNFPFTAEDHHVVNYFYFSVLFGGDEIFPISDDKYADDGDHHLRTLKGKQKEIGESSHGYFDICMDLKPREEMFKNQNRSNLFCVDCIGEHVAAKNNYKYAEKLQLQQVLYSSTTSSVRDEKVVRVDVDDDGDQHFGTFKGKQEEIGESSYGYCGICMDAKSREEMFRNQNCSHLYCVDCIGGHVAAKIQENIAMVKCPEPKCEGVIEPEYCHSIIPKEVFDRWEDALCENVVLESQKFYCPFKDCSAMMISDEEEVVITSSECPHCHRLFCAQCKVSWHAGIDCEKFQRSKREKGENEDSLSVE
ncbi:uncharacterized protein LOC128194051 [Vigna angularis]|uniref:uncharacterized protein LOC128194051 n=1 Tax=Phaseolus angularis TaxID=3914 RepID=UPI0022B42ADC|nr:uncharacterized protein LOC128194051 [Vigna angularis]